MAMETKKSFRAILALIIVIAGFCCFAQQINAQEVTKKPNKPDVKIKVNKQFDDKGNVTRYDSTYSYSWSGNGQMPTDVDSILRGFNKNFFFRSNSDSLFNGMGFGWPMEDDPFFNHPFSHDFNKQFEEFFRGGNMFPSDSSSGNNPNDLLRKDYREILKQQQQRMEQFFRQLHQNRQPLIPAPDDTIPQKQLPKEKVKPENQNSNRIKKTEKIITV